MRKELNFNRNNIGRTHNAIFRLTDEDGQNAGVNIEVGEGFKRADQERLGERVSASYNACRGVPIEIIEGGALERLVRVCRAFEAGDVSEVELTAMLKTLGIVEEKAQAAGGD